MALKAYELMDASESKTLRVEQCGDIYVDGGCDITCTITDEDGSELAYTEFDECTSALDVTEWANCKGFEFAKDAGEFAERVIESALLFGERSVDEAVSAAWRLMGRE